MSKIGDFPDLEYAKTICKIGQGAQCCRYLTMHPDGWSCEKHSKFKKQLDRRVFLGTIHALSDNCGGKDSRT